MSETIFIAAILVASLLAFILFFLWFSAKGHNKALARRKVVLADIIWKNKLEISEQETINNYVLGLDKVNFMLLYVNFGKEKEEVSLLDLWQIKSLRLTTEDNSVYEQQKGKTVLVDKQVSRLLLEITMLDELEKINLVLFEYQDGLLQLPGIKDKVNYWQELITSFIKHLPRADKARAYA